LIEIIAQDREEILSPLDPGQLNGDPCLLLCANGDTRFLLMPLLYSRWKSFTLDHDRFARSD